jgi:hypothetical protein
MRRTKPDLTFIFERAMSSNPKFTYFVSYTFFKRPPSDLMGRGKETSGVGCCSVSLSHPLSNMEAVEGMAQDLCSKNGYSDLVVTHFQRFDDGAVAG